MIDIDREEEVEVDQEDVAIIINHMAGDIEMTEMIEMIDMRMTIGEQVHIEREEEEEEDQEVEDQEVAITIDIETIIDTKIDTMTDMIPDMIDMMIAMMTEDQKVCFVSNFLLFFSFSFLNHYFARNHIYICNMYHKSLHKQLRSR